SESLSEHVADRDRADRGPRHARQLEHRHAGRARADFELDVLVLELAVAQLAAKGFARRGAGILADERIEQTLFGGELGLGADGTPLLLAHLRYADLDEVAHDLLDVAAHIADLRELRGLDLEEGGIGEPGEAPRDLGLAAARRADHQDV